MGERVFNTKYTNGVYVNNYELSMGYFKRMTHENNFRFTFLHTNKTEYAYFYKLKTRYMLLTRLYNCTLGVLHRLWFIHPEFVFVNLIAPVQTKAINFDNELILTIRNDFKDKLND